MEDSRHNFYAKAIEGGFLAGAFLVPLVFMQHWNTLDPTSVKAALWYLLVLALGALWLLECAAAGRVVFVRTRLDLPIAAFLLWNLLSLLWTRYDYATLTQCGKYCSYALGYFLLVTHLRTPRQLRRLVRVMLVSAGVTGLYGLAQLLGRDWFHWTSSDVRLVSSLGNSTLFAAHLVLLLPLALGLFLLGSGGRRWSAGALAGLMYFCLLLTYTRAAWLGLGVALVVGAALLWGSRESRVASREGDKAPEMVTVDSLALSREAREGGRAAGATGWGLATVGLLLFLATLTVLAALYGPYSLTGRLASSFQVDLSNVQRMMSWRAAGQVFLAHPLLGTGAGTLMHHLSAYLDPEFYNIGQATWVGHAHEEILEQAAETGAVGLGLFLWILVSFASATGRAARQAGDRTSRYLTAATLCGLLAFLAQNLAGVSLRYPTGGVYFWLLLGLGIALARPHPTASGEEAERPSRPASLALQILLALILAAVVAVAGREIVNRPISDIHTFAAMTDRSAARYAQAYPELQTALSLNPYSLAAYSTLGALAVNTGDYPRALAAFAALQGLDAEYAGLNRGLGEAYLGLRRYPEALAAYELDAKLEHSPVSLTELARAYAAAGQLGKALAASDQAVRIVEQGRPWLHMEPAEVYLRRAQIRGLAREWDPAAQDVARAETLWPQSARPRLVQGDLYRDRGHYARAIEEYQQARDLDPADPQPDILMGMACLAQGQAEAALGHFQAALVREPGNDYVKIKLGEALARVGRREEARQELEKVAQSGGPEADKAKQTETQLGLK